MKTRGRHAIRSAGALVTVTLLSSHAAFAAASSNSFADPELATRAAWTATSDPGIWLVGYTGQDFAERVQYAVTANPEVADEAALVIDKLQAKAKSGEDVELPGSEGGPASDLAALDEASDDVEYLTSLRNFGSRGARRGGPTDFDLRGFAIRSNRVWEVKTELDGAFCASNCQVTDKIRQTWRITPQRNVDVFAFTSVYLKNSGNFENIYADVYVECNGSPCGSAQAGEGGNRDGSGSGQQGVEHQNQANKETVDKLRLVATFKPNNTRYYDGVRTGTALCLGGSKMYCLF